MHEVCESRCDRWLPILFPSLCLLQHIHRHLFTLWLRTVFNKHMSFVCYYPVNLHTISNIKQHYFYCDTISHNKESYFRDVKLWEKKRILRLVEYNIIYNCTIYFISTSQETCFVNIMQLDPDFNVHQNLLEWLLKIWNPESWHMRFWFNRARKI